MTTALLLKAITLLAMCVGLLALVFLPGLVIIWAAALGYGLAAGFGKLGWVMFAFITLLMLVGLVIGEVLAARRSHQAGVPWWVVFVTLLAAIAGNFALPVAGGILAALAALFLIEWMRCRDWRKALHSMRGLLIGWGWGFVIRFIMGLVMIGLWLIWAWV
ncbi:MAG: DUF456 domain-containing protein [Anaerolineales bacterium]